MADVGEVMNWWREYGWPAFSLAAFCVCIFLFWSGALQVVHR